MDNHALPVSIAPAALIAAPVTSFIAFDAPATLIRILQDDGYGITY